MIYAHVKISDVEGKITGLAELVPHHKQFT